MELDQNVIYHLFTISGKTGEPLEVEHCLHGNPPVVLGQLLAHKLVLDHVHVTEVELYLSKQKKTFHQSRATSIAGMYEAL